ncbi:ERAD-associated protein [Rhizina undulata]
MPQTFHSTLSSNLNTPPGSYIYDIVPVGDGTFAATASDDSIRIFDAATLALKGVVEGTHSKGVTSLKSVEANILATAGRDGVVKLWDVRVGSKDVGRFKKEANAPPLLSLAVNRQVNVIAAGTELVELRRVASVNVWDMRKAELKVQYTESHNDDVTELHFHPTMNHILLSGSTDSLVNIYNLLTPPSPSSNTADDDVDETLHQVINHGSSIHRANFLFPGGGMQADIFAISHDESLAVYKFNEEIPEEDSGEEVESRVFGDVREPMGCEYVVDILPHSAGGLVVAGSYSGQWVDLVPLRKGGAGMDSWGLVKEDGIRLVGGHVEEVVRGILVDDVTSTIFTGGEDGLVKAWRNGGGEGREGGSATADAASAKAEKRGKEDRKDKKEKNSRSESELPTTERSPRIEIRVEFVSSSAYYNAMERRRKSGKLRAWAVLGLLCSSVAVNVAAQADEVYEPEPQITSIEPVAKKQVLQQPLVHREGQSNAHGEDTSGEDEKLVSQAIAILSTLDDAPSTKSRPSNARSEERLPPNAGVSTKLAFYAKQLARFLLVHSPTSLEEPVDAMGSQHKDEEWVGGVHGKKLKGAVEKLETAREIGRNPDAIFLLAEMNFYGNWSHPRNYGVAFERYKELADLTGNSTAQNMVGFMHATGVGGAVERDQAKALLYHTFAALNGDTRSEMTVAFRYYTGIGASRNCEDAAYYYKRVADKAMQYWMSGPPGGHALIKHSYRLADDHGGVYGEGASAISSGVNALRKGTTIDSAKDLDDILEYLDLMARKGDLTATFSLGKLYYDGAKNLPRNVARAKVYFMNVAKQYWNREGKVISGAPAGVERFAGRAAGYLGKMHLRGEGGPQNFDQAVKWFKRGMSNGDATSHNGLGFMYLKGYGVKQDRKKAAELFQAATDQDLPQAQINLGKLFLEEDEVEIAKRYFELAARHGAMEAYYYLAEIYNSQFSKERSCSMATAYYKIVAERVEPLHSPFAWANKAYAEGDRESALVGYMMAAEQGYEAGQANVAYLLDEQKSRLPLDFLNPQPKDPKNAELALIYWTRSAKQSNTDSLVKMGDYYLAGIGTEKDAEKAATCYQSASELQASAQALWNLGWMHENGIGVEQDFHLAKRFYDLALETNQEAYLPVTLSLLKLRVRSFWNTITGGGINAIGDDPDPIPKQRTTFRELLKQWYEATPDDYDDIYSTNIDDDPHSDEYYDADFEDDLLDSVLILALVGAIALLVWYRQQRQQAVRQQQGQPVPPNGAQGGFQVGGPEFAQWGIPH